MTAEDAKQAGAAALKGAFVAGAALVGERATGSALAGAAAGTIAETFLAFYESIASGATDALHTWHAVHGIRDDVAKLVTRVEKLETELAAAGLKPDRFDPLSREQTF